MIDETTGQNVSLDDRETKEVDEILSRFFQNGNSYYKVTKIQRILNPELDRKYEAHRQTLQKEKHPIDEVLMFHGTARINIRRLNPPIFNDDLTPQNHSTRIQNWRCRRPSSSSRECTGKFILCSMYLIHLKGKGVYTAHSPVGSVGYCIPTVGSEYKIIALRCLPGKRRDMYTDSNIHEWNDFDSNESRGSVIVHRSSAQCLVILFVFVSTDTNSLVMSYILYK